MNILIVGPSWVGDMVMAQTLFTQLKLQHPEAAIDVIAPAWSKPLLDRMPEVRRALDLPFGHGDLAICDRRRVGRELTANGYDQAIVLPNSLKSALVPFFASVPKRTGWRGEMRYGLLNDVRVLDKQAYPLMIERFIALALPEGEPMPTDLPRPNLSVDEHNVDDAIRRFGLNTVKPVLSLCPGAEFGESKRWPEAYYAETAEKMIEQGWQVWLFGSAKDQPGCDRIVSMLPEAMQSEATNLAGQTALADAIDLLSVASCVVSNDSGLMHIAAAHNRPLVVPYGSTSPDFTPPLNDRKAIVRVGLDCSPCFERECPLGHTNCMKELTSDKVIAAINEVLDGIPVQTLET